MGVWVEGEVEGEGEGEGEGSGQVECKSDGKGDVIKGESGSPSMK